MPYYLYLCDQKISGPVLRKIRGLDFGLRTRPDSRDPFVGRGPPAPISPTKLQHKACIDQNSFHAPPFAFLHSE
jgi:hypothetical protein